MRSEEARRRRSPQAVCTGVSRALPPGIKKEHCASSVQIRFFNCVPSTRNPGLETVEMEVQSVKCGRIQAAEFLLEADEKREAKSPQRNWAARWEELKGL